jgi:hypothetical protein
MLATLVDAPPSNSDWLYEIKWDGYRAIAATLRMASAAMSDPKSIASEVAKRLNITTATLYTYVNSDGTLKTAGAKILEEKQAATCYQSN